MKLFAILLLAAASFCGARAAVSSSANYEMTTIAFDSGGGLSASANYQSEISVGLTAGRTFATFFYANYMGYPAQLNTPPIASNDLRSHTHDTAVDVALSALFANDFDLDRFDTPALFGFESTTEAGGTVVQVAGALRYTPPAGFRGTDHFSYTIIDQSGDLSSADVALISTPAIQQAVNSLAVVPLGDGTLLFRYQGVANRPIYQVLTKPNLSSPDWDIYFTINSSPDGIIEFVVNPATQNQSYFQVVYF
jgi:hypothetical protein